jgi:hypothetical protein
VSRWSLTFVHQKRRREIFRGFVASLFIGIKRINPISG